MKITLPKFLNKSKAVDPIANAKRVEHDFHKLSLEELAASLNTSMMDGLSSAEAAKLLIKFGKNVIKPPSQNIVLRMISYLFTGFCGLLW